MDVNRILRVCGLSDAQVLNLFAYGSRVYGTATHGSDYDFLVIANSAINGREFRNGDYNIHVYTMEQFQTDLDLHMMVPIECFFAPPAFRLIERSELRFKLNRVTLRHETMRKSSHAWVKAKKKLTVERDQDQIGVKSLWHALRLVMFGIELARTGELVDFRSANGLWDEIKTAGTEWPFLKELYQPVYNGLCSEFRQHAEKGPT